MVDQKTHYVTTADRLVVRESGLGLVRT